MENQLVQIRSQLDRIEHFVASGGSECHSNRSVSHATVSGPVASSPWACTGSASSVSASPGVIAARDFPYMKLQTSTFTQMAGLGEDYGNMVIRLEQAAPLATSATTPILTLKHDKVVSALQSFSARIHPWYPILEDNFSTSVAALVARPFERNTDAFLVLMVLASGSFAQAASPTRSHSGALKDRPDAMYLDTAMSMLHVVVLEQSLRSVQCLVAASIHFYLLLKPLQAHDLVLLAIKKAQNLYMSGAFQDDHAAFEHWIRVYRIALLIEGELVVPLQLADSNAWETEDEISLPTGTSIWSFEANHSILPPAGTAVGSPPHTNGTSASITSSPAVTPAAETEPPAQSIRPDEAITYLLAEIAMRRMLRRNTTAITISADGIAEYAPLVAKELETQLEQWCSVLPGPLRFARDFEPLPPETPLQTPFLRTQYWACMVSFYWPAVVQVMELQRLVGVSVDGCRSYFHSYREFTKSAAEALKTCLPNKWTIYARYALGAK